jgi:hypothetical protein
VIYLKAPALASRDQEEPQSGKPVTRYPPDYRRG